VKTFILSLKQNNSKLNFDKNHGSLIGNKIAIDNFTFGGILSAAIAVCRRKLRRTVGRRQKKRCRKTYWAIIACLRIILRTLSLGSNMLHVFPLQVRKT
jgi:hypothetical protein